MSWIRTAMACAMATTTSVWGGCGDDDPQSPEGFEELDLDVCDPNNGPFSAQITNRFLPLGVGHQSIYEGTDGDIGLRVEIETLDRTESVSGVATRVVRVAELEDGEIAEQRHIYYAQASDSTVCLFGADVSLFGGGKIVGNDGSWRAGKSGALPGIAMPGDPRMETQFKKSRAPGIAEEQSAILDDDGTAVVPAATFRGDVVIVRDWSPLRGETSVNGEDAFYAAGIGLVQRGALKLIELRPSLDIRPGVSTSIGDDIDPAASDAITPARYPIPFPGAFRPVQEFSRFPGVRD